MTDPLWMITGGEYSDYHVLAVFDQREDAEAALKVGMGDRIEQVMRIPPGGEVERWRYAEARAALNPDGTDRSTPYPVPNREGWRQRGVARRPEVDIEIYDVCTHITVRAETEELAMKVLRERVAKARAELMGL